MQEHLLMFITQNQKKYIFQKHYEELVDSSEAFFEAEGWRAPVRKSLSLKIELIPLPLPTPVTDFY